MGKKYKFDKVLRELKESIASGKYKFNDFLPPERELVETFDISRGTLRSVLKRLSAEGIIRINPRKGAVVLSKSLHQGLKRFIVRLQLYSFFGTSSEQTGLLIGICRSTSKHHAEAVISFEEDKTASDIIKKYNSGDIQGVIMGDCRDYNEYARHFDKLGIPYVSSNLEYDIDIPCVKVDFRAVGRTAGRHLVELGHRDIGVISGPLDSFIYKEMLAGFKGALAEEDVFLSPDNVIQVPANTEKARLVCHKFFESNRNYTALFTLRDYRAAVVFNVCRELGIGIPDDISVISYDNITWPGAESAGLTTVSEDIQGIGEAAVDMLAEWVLEGKRPQNRIFTGELIVRSSCRRL